MSEGAQDQASLFKMLVSAFKEAIVAGRSAPLDPEKEKRKERDRERMRAQIKESNIELLRRYMACNQRKQHRTAQALHGLQPQAQHSSHERHQYHSVGQPIGWRLPWYVPALRVRIQS